MIMACWWGSYRAGERQVRRKTLASGCEFQNRPAPRTRWSAGVFCVPKSDLTFLLLFCQLGERLDRFGRQIDHHRPAQDREQPGWDFERA